MHAHARAHPKANQPQCALFAASSSCSLSHVRTSRPGQHNTQPGDGPRFKGAGLTQLSGRADYQAFADYMGKQNITQGCNYVATYHHLS